MRESKRMVKVYLHGESLNFIKELEELGLNDIDIIAKALQILKIVHETKRVGLIRDKYINSPGFEIDKCVQKLFQVVPDKEVNNKPILKDETNF